MISYFPVSYNNNSLNLPNQRWYIYPPQPEHATELAAATGLSPLLTQVLINREILTPELAGEFLQPDSQSLPDPRDEFPDLRPSLELLKTAIANQEKIAICGDYDADGMTSTALLLRALSSLSADVDYAIPSRMHEGYGINERIVEEFTAEGVKLVLTVDNGISAVTPIAKARELGLTVIITDHHDLPETLPPANAILNPKLLPLTSPYRGVAGVGVAYILALTLAQELDPGTPLVNSLLELFTLGTIADLAPLTGVNRRWVKQGLKQLPESELAGVQALIQVAGVAGTQSATAQPFPHNSTSKTAQKTLKPEDIGFRLGPRINAVGRLDDPQIVIELLTTDDLGIALTRAMQCEEINQRRQQLCAEIEAQAVDWCERHRQQLQADRVLVIVEPGWHHGVIGIVASRLVERYGVPVFIGTYEPENEGDDPRSGSVRGSARGIPEFHVFQALQFCDELLGKYGGHKAAGGFSLLAQQLPAFRAQLSVFAHQCLQPQHLKPLVTIDVQADLAQIDLELYRQIDHIEPCGIENKAPVFWTPNVRVMEQRIVGGKHLKLTLGVENSGQENQEIHAIAWRWGEYFPLPSRLDLAYQLRENTWNGETKVELEILGVRLPTVITPVNSTVKVTKFEYNGRGYVCSIASVGEVQELRIRDDQGQVLAVQQGQTTGLLGMNRESAKIIKVSEEPFYSLITKAVKVLQLKG